LNLYLDTSALVKLYVREAGSAAVSRHVLAAERVFTSRVAYPEARAAFARRHREQAFSERSLRSIVSRLDRDWPAYVVVDLLDPVARRAGILTESRALRGFDAIHLASALEVATLLGEPVRFLAYDTRLATAAVAEGLTAP
jgi:predicted nucleic acid-binding protein